MPRAFLHDIARRLFEIGRGQYLLDRIDVLCNNQLRSRGILSQAFEFKVFNDVPGDYFEFGLWRGATFLMAHHMKHRYRLDQMKLWGFDSFEGLPEIDDTHDTTWRKGEYACSQYACSQDEFRRILYRRGVRKDEYELISGYYDRSLNADLHDRLSGRKATVGEVMLG